MHGAIRNRLEELVRPGRAAVLDKKAEDHLSACDECSSELAVMREQSEMLRTLKGPENVEIPATFYSGVMRLIEERRRTSIWASLIYSPVGMRLIYASLVVTALVGSFVVTQEERDGHLGASVVIAKDTHYDAPVFGDQSQQRDAVLTNFASH